MTLNQRASRSGDLSLNLRTVAGIFRLYCIFDWGSHLSSANYIGQNCERFSRRLQETDIHRSRTFFCLVCTTASLRECDRTSQQYEELRHFRKRWWFRVVVAARTNRCDGSEFRNDCRKRTLETISFIAPEISTLGAVVSGIHTARR